MVDEPDATAPACPQSLIRLSEQLQLTPPLLVDPLSSCPVAGVVQSCSQASGFATYCLLQQLVAGIRARLHDGGQSGGTRHEEWGGLRTGWTGGMVGAVTGMGVVADFLLTRFSCLSACGRLRLSARVIANVIYT